MIRCLDKEVLREEPRDKLFTLEKVGHNIGGHAVRGFALTLLSQVGKRLVGLVSTIILARLLTPMDFGLVGMVTAIVGLLNIFKDLGLSYATIQRSEITREEVSTLFWVNTILGILFCVLTAASSPIISWFYGEVRLTNIAVALSIGFIFSGMTVQHYSLLKRRLRFKALVTIDVVALIASTITGILLAYAGAGVYAIVMQQVMHSFVTAVGTWMLCRWIPGSPLHLRKVRGYLLFGSNITGFNIFNYLARNLDNVLIGRFCGAEQLGFYSKAYSLLLFPLMQMNGPIGNVAIPTLSRLSVYPDRYRNAYLRILEKVTILTMPAVAFLLGTSDWLIELTLGPQWSQTSGIFALLAIVGLVQPIANTTGWLFITQDRTKEQLQWGMIGGSLAVLSFIVGIPWGTVGVAASYALSGILIRKPLLFWFVGRRGPVRTADFYKTSMPAFTAAVCVGGAIWALRFYLTECNPLLGMCYSLGIGVLVTLLALVLTRRGRLALIDMARVSLHLNKGS